MALSDLWENSRDQLEDKHVQQIIAFAGDGHLKDGNPTSEDFRAYLSLVPPDYLKLYSDQCLKEGFNGSGLVLQDIVNEIGSRIGFNVVCGRYRGVTGQIGFDGLWRLPDDHAIVVEVKTTDVYRIDLGSISGYRQALIKSGEIENDQSSILIVVGRVDTGDLEAQVRGSRHAWDIRLVSVDALLRLMFLKLEVDNPQIIKRMHEILIPKEFTKLDQIVEILFSTAEDIKDVELEEDENIETIQKPKFRPVSFNEACADRIEKHLNIRLNKQSKAFYSTTDGKVAVNCAVSKQHIQAGALQYWYAFHPYQKDRLEKYDTPYVAFGCGSEKKVVLIPFQIFTSWLNAFNTTQKDDKFYWHIKIKTDGNSFVLLRKGGEEPVILSEYILPEEFAEK